jgi:hypothetical protein
VVHVQPEYGTNFTKPLGVTGAVGVRCDTMGLRGGVLAAMPLQQQRWLATP